MTKAALCLNCADIFSPYRHDTDRWRWCACEGAGVRWRDGDRGLLEVTSLGGSDQVRVIGINNRFLAAAVSRNPYTADGSRSNEQWRAIHEDTCAEVEPHYLFHKDKRACWALIVAVGESGDVFFIPYPEAAGPGAGRQKETT